MSTDRFVIRCVIITLVVTAIGTLIAMVALALTHNPIPASIDRAFVGSFSALAGVLAKTSTASDDLTALVNATPAVPQSATPAPEVPPRPGEPTMDLLGR